MFSLNNKERAADLNSHASPMWRRIKTVLGAGILLAISGGIFARADNLNFSYSSLADGASDTAIQNLMNTQMGAWGSVVVTGAIASRTWTADGNVVGNTLYASDGTFIMNNQPSSDEIKMVFSGLAPGTYTFSFDLEIFPDITCSTSSCTKTNANWPDFELDVDGTMIQEWLGIGTPGTSHNPQLLGNSSTPGQMGPGGIVSPSFTITSSGPNRTATLEFIDWPPEIAIAKLDISRVPETSSVLLLGTLSLMLIPLVRRFRKA
jgi:hypothetical protein